MSVPTATSTTMTTAKFYTLCNKQLLWKEAPTWYPPLQQVLRPLLVKSKYLKMLEFEKANKMR